MENSQPVSDFIIRPAERSDCNDISKLVKDLAEFEKMGDQARLTGKDFERDAFDSNPPYFHCIVAEMNSKSNTEGTSINRKEIVGFGLYAYHYSTWEGKMIHLEDLYVTPTCRHAGLGSKMLKYLAKMCVDEGFVRLKFECLEWNEPAIKFYEKHNAVNFTKAEKWNCFRFGKAELALLAKDEKD